METPFRDVLLGILSHLLVTLQMQFPQIDIAPKGWEQKNLEIVFSTEVRNGEPGAPGILATHYW